MHTIDLTDDDVAILSLRKHILLFESHRIIEYVSSCLERDTVLFQVRCCLVIIPAELQLVVLAHGCTIRKFRIPVKRLGRILVPSARALFIVIVRLISMCTSAQCIVESRCGAVAVGASQLLPSLSDDGAAIEAP